MSRRQWTNEEVDYLQDSWGGVSVKGIAKRLERSIPSIKNKARKLGLGDPMLHFDGITISQLMQALDKSYNTVYSWIARYNMPVKEKLFMQEKRVKVIGYKEFWEWAEQHKELLNFAKIEENAIGAEPAWVKVKRSADKKRSQRTWLSTAWTEKEDQRLLQMVKLTNMTYPELASLLSRTESSIRRRLYDLNSKHLPKRMGNAKYTDKDIYTLKEMAIAGYGYETIAKKIGKSANGVRGKLERMNFDFKRRQFRQAANE